MTERPPLGAVVHDREDSDPNDAVVVNLPSKACENWVAYHDDGDEVTVADDNPEYDAEAPVVVVAFRGDLETAHPEYDGERPLELPPDCPVYAFPPSRLERVDDDVADTPPQELQAIHDRLAEVATVDLVETGAEFVLLVEKLGTQYEVRADGSVTDGPIADRLREAVDDVLDEREEVAA